MRSVLCVLVGVCLMSSVVAGQDGGKSAQAPVAVGGAIAAPQKRSHVQPVYPAMARQTRTQGMVSLSVVIGANGAVERAAVVKSIPALNDAAIAAVKQWKYAPTLVKGTAVPVTMVVHVNFAL
jgi:protein TonB